MTYQRNTLMSILENWNEVSNAQEVAADSLGTTEQKYADYMDSIEAHLNQLSTTWSQFLLNLDVSGKANAVVDAINGIVKVLDFLINKTPVATIAVTALVAALTRLAAVNLGKFANSMINFANSIMNLSNGKGTLSGILSFFTTGAFAKGMGTATKEMGNLAKGGTAVAKAMSQGGTQFASFGKAATAAMTGATASTVGTTTAVTSLGAALATVGKMLGVIGLIGGAIWGVSTILDALITTDAELEESIQTHQDNVTEMESVLEDYNSTLETNKQRIEEINNLKGTSSWTPELQEEADVLTAQNTALENKIKLEERLLELEKASLFTDQKEEFERNYGDSHSYNTGFMGGNVRLTGTEAVQKEWEDNTKAIKQYKYYVDETNKAVAEGNDENIQKYSKLADTQYEQAKEAEDGLIEQIKYLEEYKETAETAAKSGIDGADEQAKKAQEMLGILMSMPTTVDGFATIGDYLGYTTSSMDGATESAKSLSEQFKEIANVEIVPKDVGDMESFLASLDSADLEALEWLFEKAGNGAQYLAEQMSMISAQDAIAVANAAMKEYNGTIDDCSRSLNEFNTALETDFDTQTKGIIQMLDYFQKSGGLNADKVQNIAAYNAAKEGLGFDTIPEDEINKATQAWNKYWDASTGDVKLDKFKEDMFAQEGLIKSWNNGTKIQIEDMGAMADELGLTDEMFMALLNSASRWMEITNTSTSNALQENLKEVAQAAQDASHSMIEFADANDAVRTYEAGTGNIQWEFDLENKDVEAKVQAEVDRLKEIAQTDIVAKTGIGIELDQDNLNHAYSQLQNYFAKIKQLVDENGNINITPITSAIEDIGNERITIDGSNIDINTDGLDVQGIESLQGEIQSQLESEFDGMDIGALLSNAIQSGGMTISLNGADVTGTDELADAVGSDLANKVQNAVNADEITITNITAGQLQSIAGDFNGLKGAVDLVTEATGKADDAVETLNGKNVNNTSQSVQGLADSASNASSNLSSVSSWIDIINNKNGITVRVNYIESNKPELANGGIFTKNVTKAANGVNIPAYAKGKVGEPLRTETNANALVGEEAPELVVSKNGKQRIVGQNGAEFVHLNPGDTVIPANVTKMIQNGEIGQFAGGGKTSATMTGSSNWGTINVGTVESLYTGNSISGSSSGSSSSSSSSKRSSSSSGGSSSSSGSSEDPAENLLAELEHRRNMEYITEEQYLEELTKIWETYYKGKADMQDKDWQYEEEIHELRKKMIEDEIDTLEYKNGILERTYGTENQQIQNLVRMQELYHQQADEYRANGFGDLSPEIRELSEAWWSAYDEIKDLQNQMFENEIENLDHYIGLLDSKLERIPKVFDDFSLNMEDFTEKLNDNLDQYMGIQSQKVKLYEQQLSSIQNELNRLYKEGYEVNRDLIMDLEQQAEDVKGNILDIAEQVRDMKLEVIDQQLDRQGELQQAIIEYVEEQIELIEDENEALQEQIDALEKANEEKEKANELEKLSQDLEKAREQLENAKKNRMKRVYHADTGWIWEADQAAIDDAEQAVNDAQEALDEFYLQQQIDQIQALIDKNNERIENWNDYIEKVQESSEVFSKEQRRQLLEMEYGRDYGKQILDDMNANLELSVENAVGILGGLVDKYNEIYEAQLRVQQMSAQELLGGLSGYGGEAGLTGGSGSGGGGGGSSYNDGSGYVYWGKTTDLGDGSYKTSAEIPGYGYTSVTIKDGKVQETSLPVGTVVYTKGGEFKITSSSSGSNKYTSVKTESGNVVGENIYGKTESYYKGGSSSSSGGGGNSSSSSGKGSSSSSRPGGIAGGIASAIGSVVSGVVNAIKGSSSSSKKSSSSSSKSSSSSSGRKAADKASNFAEGGVVDYTGGANVHGTSTRSEVVFNSTDAKKLYDLIHNNTLSNLENDVINKLSSIVDNIGDYSKDNGTNIKIDNINLPSVKNGNDFVRQLKIISLNR